MGIGEIVHYVGLRGDRGYGVLECRPAIVVRYVDSVREKDMGYLPAADLVVFGAESLSAAYSVLAALSVPVFRAGWWHQEDECPGPLPEAPAEAVPSESPEYRTLWIAQVFRSADGVRVLVEVQNLDSKQRWSGDYAWSLRQADALVRPPLEEAVRRASEEFEVRRRQQ